jgi:peptidyl-prolyl cis-trans isomerase B (cyclophilin B)
VTRIVVTMGPVGSGCGDELASPPQASKETSATDRTTNRIRRGPRRTGGTPHLGATIFGDSLVWRRPLKTATFDTNRGTITAELYDKDAPKTVENFEKLANAGFYDGVKFHRVIPDFVVQGGDPYSRDLPDGDPRIGSGGPGYKIKCETAGNPRKHEVGSLSMAHAGKDTGGSQFFMVLSEQNTRHLNGVHTVFGKITEGLDVMKQLKKSDVMTKVRVA